MGNQSIRTKTRFLQWRWGAPLIRFQELDRDWLSSGRCQTSLIPKHCRMQVCRLTTMRETGNPGDSSNRLKMLTVCSLKWRHGTDSTGVRGNGYKLGLMAGELLASLAGQSSLFDFYKLLQPGTTWQEAFGAAFGMTVEEFYELFEKTPRRRVPRGRGSVDPRLTRPKLDRQVTEYPQC